MLPFLHQLYAFGMTIVAGAAAGLLFDMYRLVRRATRPKALTSWFIDLAFWLVVTPVLFALLLLSNWGELRFYVLLGLLAGGVLYFGLLSEVVLSVLSAGFHGLGRLLLTCGQLLIAVVMAPLQLGRQLAWALGIGRYRWPTARWRFLFRPPRPLWPAGNWRFARRP